jgi:hypothetical protein
MKSIQKGSLLELFKNYFLSPYPIGLDFVWITVGKKLLQASIANTQMFLLKEIW